MGEINLSREEQVAFAALDLVKIDSMIEKAVQYESATDLRQALSRCGPFVAQKLRYFEKALEAHRKAKAARKREQTAYDVRKDASDLKWAVWAMHDRMETERKNEELFHVEDNIFWPRIFSPNLSVRIAYRWRRTVEDDWNQGAITFTHQVDTRPSYLLPRPRKKLSPAKQKEALQEGLAMDWQHLMRLGLYSVRDYLEAGHDGSEIPETFEAVADGRSRGLNNYSCDFWRRRERLSPGGGQAPV
jgi:hypothetical protein